MNTSLKLVYLYIDSLLHVLFIIFSSSRAPAVWTLAGGGLHLAPAQCRLQWQRLQQLTGRGRHQDCQIRYRSIGRAACVRLHALHLSNRLYSGKRVCCVSVITDTHISNLKCSYYGLWKVHILVLGVLNNRLTSMQGQKTLSLSL